MSIKFNQVTVTQCSIFCIDNKNSDHTTMLLTRGSGNPETDVNSL